MRGVVERLSYNTYYNDLRKIARLLPSHAKRIVVSYLGASRDAVEKIGFWVSFEVAGRTG
jgi:hypothetical protein